MDKKTLLFALLLCCATLLHAQTYVPSEVTVSGKAPKGITIKNDALYIAFSGDNKVVKTSLDGKTQLLEITGLNSPFDVDCDNQGRIFVADKGSGTVKVYNSLGELQTSLSLTDISGNTVSGTLNGVTVDTEGKIYLAVGASSYNAVHVYDKDLKLIRILKSIASNTISGCDKFRVIRKVYFDNEGFMYIADQNTGLIKVASYTDDTVTPAFLIKKEGKDNKYNNVAGVVETSNGNLIISLDANKSLSGSVISYKGLYRFSATGIFVDNIGTPGSDEFGTPYGLAVDSNDNLYIADTGNNKVVMWKAADITAPVVSKLGLSNIVRSSVDLSLQTDEPAEVYWTIGDADAAPTVETVKQGDSFEITEANALVTKTLQVGSVTDKRIYLVLEDKIGNVSEVMATDLFTTDQPLAITSWFTLANMTNSVVIEANANESGTIYWIFKEDEVAPTTVEIENATGAVAHGYFNVTAGNRRTFDVSDLKEQRYHVYAFMKSGTADSPIVHTVTMPAGDAEKIYRRYYSFLTGDQPDYTNNEIMTRYQALRSLVLTARQKLPLYQCADDLEPYDYNTKCEDLRDLLGNVLLPLALNYQLQGPADEPNEDYHNPQLLQEILGLYAYLEKRGFVSGSGLGFGTDGPYLGLAGYFYANILMREELLRNGQWPTVSANMKWATRMVTDDTEGLDDDNKIWGALVEHNGSRADGVRSVYHNRLMTLACLTDDELTREDDLEYFRKTMEQNLKVGSAWDGFIKPDFTGYHHYGVWGNAYNIDALHTSCQMAMMLHDTDYAFSETAVNNLANSLLAFRQYSGKYDISRGLCGRFPNQLGTLLSNMPAFAYLYNVVEGDMRNRIGGAFCRLYDPNYSEVVAGTLKDVKCDIYFHGGMQSVQLMNALKAKNLTDNEISQSNCTYPYAAMQVHRRGEWMAAVKGYSKYVWDFETNGGQNWIGRNQSAGGLSLYATKDAEGVVSSSASGLGYNGWDWVHVPGATVLDMSVQDIVKEAKAFQWAKFSPQSFAGGVSLEGKHGLYSMIYDDIRQAYDYDNGRKWLGVKLTANKSYFFFDDEIVALGSAIKNTHDTYDAHTTLFQNELQDVNTPLYINGEAKTGVSVEETLSTDAPCYLTDAVGNGYVLPNANGLTVKRSVQSSVKDGNTDIATTGNYAKAWLDHGKASNGAYHYLIYVGGAEKVKSMSGAPELPYTVQQQDDKAHIVYHPAKKLKGYALFQAVEGLDDNYLSSVSVPCMAMLRETGAKNITLSVSNPELGFYPKGQFPYQVWSIDENKRFLDSEVQPVDVTLKGEWSVTVENPQVERISYDADKNTTTIRFNGKDAESLEVALTTSNMSGICSLPEAVSFTCYPNPFNEQLTIDFSSDMEGNHTIQLCDVSGRIVYSASLNGGNKAVVPTASLASGVYMLLIDGQMSGAKLMKK